MHKASGRRWLGIVLVSALVAAFPTVVAANHSWGNYHWARTSNPFTLKVGDNVDSTWDSYLDTSITDWTTSSVLDLTKVAGGAGRPRQCRPTSGRVEVCNTKYGNNGWLGVASIWAQGDHITQGTVKLNDTYFSTSTYDTPAWRNMVMCQEIGHTLGLAHQDENFNNPNLGTCMDYTNSPASNQHPNAHDYAQLEAIYTHLDTTTTVGQVATSGSAAPGWGRLIRSNGRSSLFALDLGNGMVVFSFVIWAR